MFDKEIYIRRREALRNATGSGLVLLFGNDECGVNYEDNT